jgi:hypothetical protein
VKPVWIFGLLILSVLFAYDRISANLYRAGEPATATPALAPVAPSLPLTPSAAVAGDAYAADARNPPRSPVRPVSDSANKNDAAITIAEYVMLHQTRIEFMPTPPDRRAASDALK